MTEQEATKRVRDAVAALNDAVREAAFLGVETELEMHDFNRIDGLRTPLVNAKLRKAL